MIKAFETNEPEHHLFIIWANGIQFKKMILQEIECLLDLRDIINITWDPKEFPTNIRRFYGRNLPERSQKTEECGKGEFLLIIVKDSNPLYAPRYTNQGINIVNANMFDIKERIRKRTKLNILHATNSVSEFNHDITLLSGLNGQDFIDNNYKINERDEKGFVHMPGAKGWRTIEELLYVLNATMKYVVLRNFEEFPENIQFGKHSDIDLLCKDYISTKLILGGESTTDTPKRVQNRVIIKDEYVNFDLRHVGDGYYYNDWEEAILDNRVWDERGFYKPDTLNYLYSLAYHALIQKNHISNDYINRIDVLCKNAGIPEIDLADEAESIKRLTEFMKQKGYCYVEPSDMTVAYNYYKVGGKASLTRRVHYFKNRVSKHIKSKK